MNEQINDEKRKFMKTKLFNGIVIWINGRTKPSSLVLKSLIVKNGGSFQIYYSAKKVTHIIASEMSNQKRLKFKDKTVVKAEWIIDSIKAGTLLSEEKYSLFKRDDQLIGISQKEMNCTDPNFLEKYFASSRLHHIALWKSTFKDKLIEQLEPLGNSYKIVMHVDIDCFFVSVILIKHPELKGLPVAVSNGTKGADIACCSYEARKYGIKNGMWVITAKQLCPELVTVDYDFDAYEEVSKKMFLILSKYSKKIEVLSCDECIVDISTTRLEELDSFIKNLRNEIKSSILCPVSIGVGPNPLIARLAMKKSKPDGYFIQLSNIDEFMNNIHISELPGIGPSLQQKCSNLGIITCFDVMLFTLDVLQKHLGESNAKKLYEMAKGNDIRTFDHPPRQSISVNINWGLRFTNNIDIYEFIFRVCCEVSNRIKEQKVTGSLLTIQIMVKKEGVGEAFKYKGHGDVNTISKSSKIESNDSSSLTQLSIKLYKQFNIPPNDLRGLSIQISHLESIVSTKIKDSAVYKLLMKSKENHKDSHQEIQSHQMEEVPLPNASQIDKEVFKELPPSIQNELVEHYSRYYNIYNNPRVTFLGEIRFVHFFFSSSLSSRQSKR